MAGRFVLMAAVLLVAACGEDAVTPEADRPAGRSNPETETRVRFFELYREARRTNKSGDPVKAERLLHEALVLQPHHEPATILLAELRARAGDRAEALNILTALCRASPDLDRPPRLMAELLTDTRPGWSPAPDRAVTLYRDAVRRNPNDSGPWLRLARALRMRGDLEPARTSLMNVLGTHANSGQALLGLAELELTGGHPEKAVAHLVQALKTGTQAHGRKDVPSEMDTADTFATAEATSPRNIRAFVALARAARSLGAYPKSVPTSFRLQDLSLLGPLTGATKLAVDAGGRPIAFDHDGDGVDEVLLPGAPGGTHPCCLTWVQGNIESEILGHLPARGSGAVADLTADGKADLLLGGLHPDDSLPFLFVNDWATRGGGQPARQFVLTGQVLGTVQQQPGFRGVLAACGGTVATRGLILITGVAASGIRTRFLLRQAITWVQPISGGLAVICDGGRLVRLQPDKPDGVLSTPLTEGRDPHASCLALVDVNGDGHEDLLVGRAAPLHISLQALVGASSEPFESIRFLAGRPDGSFETRARPLAGVPPLVVRQLIAVSASAGQRAALVAVCGDGDPAAYTPSRLCSPDASGTWQARVLPLASPLRANAFTALIPRGWGSRLLLMRGGCRKALQPAPRS